MILFQTETVSLDLSSIGITINEQNNRFGNTIVKDYSFPFTFYLTEEIAIAFGFPNIKNLSGYTSKIYGNVIRNNEYYKGYVDISRIQGRKATSTIYFGSETLAVYDVNLRNLPFEIVNTHAVSFANSQINKQWPEATHNYVQIAREDISDLKNYEAFEGFLNNYDSGFITNSSVIEEENTVFLNKNVMVPMPYLMEVLKVGYGTENLELRGSFVEDTFNSKIVMIPDTFLERFSTIYNNIFSFSSPSLDYISGDMVVSEYSKTLYYPNSGSYTFVFQINLPKALASYFDINIQQDNTTIFSFTSTNQDVKINEELVVNTTGSGQLRIVLKLKQTDQSISAYNFFKFESQDGQLNIFPDSYNIADFLPDATFRDFVNALKNWLNLETYTYGNSVYINYIEKELPLTVFKSFTHLEIKEPIRDINANKVYVLRYDDGQEVKVNKDGVTYSDTSDIDVTEIDIPVYPLPVFTTNDVLTATYSDESTTLKLCLYNGLQNGKPLAVESVNGRSLALIEIQDLFWKYWLRFRTNSEEVEDTFFVKKSEIININKGVFKNNQKLLIDKIKTKNVNDKYNQVTINYETIMN